MKRVGVLAVMALLLVGCASSSQRSAIETAKLSYADASLAYEAAMTTIEDLRSQHLVSDTQMQKVILASAVVRQTAPAVRDALKLWDLSGEKPQNYDTVVKSIFNAVQIITSVLAEVKK